MTRPASESFVEEPGRRDLTVVSGGRIRGELILLHFRWVWERFEERELQKLQRIFSTLAGMQGLGYPRPRDWYPIGWLIRIDRAICELHPEIDDGRILEEMGSAMGSQLSPSGVASARVTNRVHFAIQNSLETLSSFEESSTMDYQPLTISSGRVIRQSATFHHPAWCRLMLGFLTGVLSSESAIASRVIETECATDKSSRCIFELRWL